jgi:hypothetical protein
LREERTLDGIKTGTRGGSAEPNGSGRDFWNRLEDAGRER